MSRARELLAALMHANTGGFPAHTPGFDGGLGLGLVGVHGVPRARRWDAAASARAPGLDADTVAFVVLDDGTVLVDDDLPDGALSPLADALEETISPPYRAAAVRIDGDVWSAVAETVAVLELPGIEGDIVELTVVGETRELMVDGERTIRPLRELDSVVEERGDLAAYAERVDGDLFAVDVYPL